MREYGPGRPLVFSHIPKTAGTSLSAALRQSLQPAVFVQGFDTSLFGGYDDIDGIRPEQRATVYLSPEQIPADAALVAGHISPGTTMARFPGSDHITILRTPQVRIFSQWLHSRAVSEFHIRHWGSAAEGFRAGWAPLREYLEHRMVAPNVDNTITRFLAWPHPVLRKDEFLDEAHDEELLAAALERLDAFGHANVAENPRFMADLGAWLGRDLPDTRLNERRWVPPKKRPDLAAEVGDTDTRALLDHRSRLDVEVWDHVARRVLPGADPAETREAAIRTAVERYGTMLDEPNPDGPMRRAVEWLYDVRVRLDPRLPARR